MGKEKKSFADFNVFGILGETLEIFYTHAKHFILIQVVLVLPFAFSFLLFLYFQSQFFPPPLFKFPSESSVEARVSLYHWSFSIVGALLRKATRAIWMSGNLYSVGMFYANTTFSLEDVIRVIPRLWKRLMITELYVLLISYPTMFSKTVIVTQMIQWGFSATWTLLPKLVFLVPFLYTALIAQLAESVSVLEEKNYGWAAFRKSLKLLQGKTWVALGFYLPIIILITFLGRMTSKILKDPFSIENLLAGVMGFVAGSFLTQFLGLCGGVAYVSFKAYHGDNIAESMVSRSVTKGVYNVIDSDSQPGDAKQGSRV